MFPYNKDALPFANLQTDNLTYGHGQINMIDQTTHVLNYNTY
jgi:hypothetical protein